MLGGAANVLNNIASLGGRAVLCGVVGEDGRGEEIVEKISALGFTTDGILVEKDRQTTIKTQIRTKASRSSGLTGKSEDRCEKRTSGNFSTS